MSNIVIGDADSLVALAYKDDANHVKARKVAEWLQSRGYHIIYPNTAILEAITSLKRALNLPDRAHLIAKQYLEGAFVIEYINEDTQKEASRLFDQKAQSKQNTIFDALVATVAANLNADSIFSFDSWYQKLGFRLSGQ